jgi:hypothetical protein
MIESIEVLAEAVHTIITQENTVRVEHRNYQEIKLIPEVDCLLVISDEPIYHASHSVAGSYLSGMNP